MKNQKQKKQLKYKGTIIEYDLYLKDQKNLRLKVEEGNIIVSAPFFIMDWELDKFLYQNIEKLIKFVNKFEQLNLIDFANKKIKILNEYVEFSFDNPKSKHFFQKYEDKEETLAKIYTVLSKQYYSFFEKQINKWKEIMNLDFKNLTVKNIKGKWGVCYPEKSKILLNIKLIHYDLKAIEYVIVHELSHLIHKNHSADFKHFIEKYLPDFRERMKILKIN